MANENTTIKISTNVKNELSTLKLDNESYSAIIKRLIVENKELRKDKELLSKILLNSN